MRAQLSSQMLCNLETWSTRNTSLTPITRFSDIYRVDEVSEASCVTMSVKLTLI